MSRKGNTGLRASYFARLFLEPSEKTLKIKHKTDIIFKVLFTLLAKEEP